LNLAAKTKRRALCGARRFVLFSGAGHSPRLVLMLRLLASFVSLDSGTVIARTKKSRRWPGKRYAVQRIGAFGRQ
jgi:hypothetical protein